MACEYCHDEEPRCGGAVPLEWYCACGRLRVRKYVQRVQDAYGVPQWAVHNATDVLSEGEALRVNVQRARGV